MTDTRYSREQAREYLVARLAALAPDFTNYDDGALRAFAADRLRWIDCAPEGARHCVAPLQDKHGEPMGATWHENVGPCKALREARAARGLDPFSGLKGAKP